ncbi:hypothetical protein G6F56_008034 [Rhizopus delemar]|nr:hypothetical protein G6F56_008034 [Rhizopus delemar]
MEIEKNENVSRGPTSNRCGSEKISGSRYHRNITFTERGLSLKFFYYPRADKTETDFGLPKIESVHSVQPFQDGGSTCTPRIDRKGRLDLQTRSERCLCGRSYAREIKTIFIIQTPGNSLSISFIGIWAECCTTSFFEANEIRNGTFAITGNKIYILFRRYLHLIEEQRGNGRGHQDNYKPFRPTRVSYKLEKEYSYPKSCTRISRVYLQHDQDDNFSSHKETEEASITDQSSDEEYEQQALSMDSEYDGKDDCDDSSHGRSVITHPTLTEGLGEIIMSQPPELGGNLSTISRKQAGARMVAKIFNKQKWVGGKFSGNGGTRSLDTRGTCTVNKRKRIKDNTIRHPNARQKISKLKYKDLYRQYDSVEVHNKSGRNSLLSPARDSGTDTECMQPIQPCNKLQPYSGNLQHKGRSVESNKEKVSIIRSLPPEVSIFVDQPTHGTVKDRCFRSSSQPEAETILELPARSRNDSSRCFSTNLAKNGTLPISSLAVDTESHTKVTSVKNQESSSDHPTMANPILVPNGVKNETHSTTNDSPIEPKLEGNRMALINNSWKNFGLNLETSQFLAKATRASTHKAYNNGWNRWATWCSEQTPRINLEEYNTKNILEYLMQHNHLSYQYLNGLRSAIASVFKHIHPTQPAIASQPEIVTFFKAKRDSEIRIPQWHQLETWDINILIVYIRSNLSPTSGLDLRSLQLKVMLLMCINTMWRPRSDIGRIQFRDVNLKFKQESSSKGISNIEGVILHIRHPKESQRWFPSSSLLPVTEKLCQLTILCFWGILTYQTKPQNQFDPQQLPTGYNKQ